LSGAGSPGERATFCHDHARPGEALHSTGPISLVEQEAQERELRSVMTMLGPEKRSTQLGRSAYAPLNWADQLSGAGSPGERATFCHDHARGPEKRSTHARWANQLSGAGSPGERATFCHDHARPGEALHSTGPISLVEQEAQERELRSVMTMLGPEKRSTQLDRSAYAPLNWADQLSGAGSPRERATFCHDHARPGEALHSTGPISLVEQEAHERATFCHDHARPGEALHSTGPISLVEQEAQERELRSVMTMLGPEKRSTQLGRSAYAPLNWADQLSGAGSPRERATFCHDHARPGEALHSTGPISLVEQEAHERATFCHDHARPGEALHSTGPISLVEQEAHERELRSVMTMLGPEKRSTQLGRSAYAPLNWADQLSGAGSPGERTTFCHDHARPGEALHSSGLISLVEQEAHERATFCHDHARHGEALHPTGPISLVEQEAQERELRSVMTMLGPEKRSTQLGRSA
ncbi:hypothetical protein RRG08_006451, partial [Elysia crispata]